MQISGTGLFTHPIPAKQIAGQNGTTVQVDNSDPAACLENFGQL